jgi:hypothetical protein
MPRQKNHLKKKSPLMAKQNTATTKRKPKTSTTGKRPTNRRQPKQRIPTQLKCYLGDQYLCHTSQISFLHFCTGCQAKMHVICGEVDEGDFSWCFNCIDSDKYNLVRL